MRNSFGRKGEAAASPCKVVAIVLALLISAGMARADDAKPLFFMQLTDPQFGMYTKNADFAQETANFAWAVATANRLKPAFVIVTGDLVNASTDKAEADEYLRIAGKLDRSIPIYHVAGNHDIGNEPTPESIAAYTARFGPDHYRIACGDMVGLVLNSSLLRAPGRAAQLAAAQLAWFKAELEKARQEKVRHVIVFMHHPLFSKQADESDQHTPVPLEQRKPYVDLLRQYGVKKVFAGHLHANVLASDGDLEIVASGAIGKPLRGDKSGLRIAVVRPSGIEHRFYEMSEVPNQIELAPPKKPAAKPAAKAVQAVK
jgi:serine/threonine-protein phosphatase CPPED1